MAEKVAIEDTFEVPQEERRQTYETTAVLSAKSSEDEREALLGKFRGIIADNGGEIIEASPAKEYTLAYPINKEQQGIMRTFVYKSDPSIPNTLSEALRHETALLRMLSIVKPKRTPQRAAGATFSTGSQETSRGADDEEAAVDTEKQDAQLDEAISNI